MLGPAVADWFRAVGHATPFESMVVLQWDILPYAPIQELYRDVADDAVGLVAMDVLIFADDLGEILVIFGTFAEAEPLPEQRNPLPLIAPPGRTLPSRAS